MVYLGELLPSEYKVLSGIINSLANVPIFVLTLIFPTLKELLTPAVTYWIFAFFGLISNIFYFFFMPETRGKTPLEIKEIFLKNYELTIILRYCTEDLLNDKMNRKQNAFNILSCLLEKRVDIYLKDQANHEGPVISNPNDDTENDDYTGNLKNFHEIFKIVLELSVNSENEVVRSRSRKLFVEYVNTPNNIRQKTLNNFTTILLDNIKHFKFDSGKTSALSILHSMPKIIYYNNEAILFTTAMILHSDFESNLVIEKSGVNNYLMARRCFERFIEVNDLGNFKSKFFERFFGILKLFLGEEKDDDNNDEDLDEDQGQDNEKRQAAKTCCLLLKIYFSYFTSKSNSSTFNFLSTKMFKEIFQKIIKLKDIESSLLVLNKLYVNFGTTFKFKFNVVSQIIEWLETNFSTLVREKLVKGSSFERKTVLLASNLLGKVLEAQQASQTLQEIHFKKSLIFELLRSDDEKIVKQNLSNIIIFARSSMQNLKFSIEKMVGLAKYESANCPKNGELRCCFMQFCCGIFIGNAQLIKKVVEVIDVEVKDEVKDEVKVEDEQNLTKKDLLLLFNPINKELTNTQESQTTEKLKDLLNKTVDFLKSNNCLSGSIFASIISQVQTEKSLYKHSLEVNRGIEEKKNPEKMIVRKKKRNEKVGKRRSGYKVQMEMDRIKRRKEILDEVDLL